MRYTLDAPTGDIQAYRNGKWESCGLSDAETPDSIRRMNDKAWHFPAGTKMRYTWAGKTIYFEI